MAREPEPQPGTNERPVLHRGRWPWSVTLRPQRSIRARLQLSHLVTSLLPLLVLGTALLYAGAQSERRIVERTQESLAAAIALDITRLFGQIDRELLEFGRQLPSSEGDTVQLQQAVDLVFPRYPNILEMAFVDIGGKERARASRLQSFRRVEGRDRSAEPFFAVANGGRIHHSIVRGVNGNDALQVAVPARDSVGNVMGVVVAQFGTQSFEGRLLSIPPETARSAFVIDESGTVVLGEPSDALVDSSSLRAFVAGDKTTETLTATDGRRIAAARAPIDQRPGQWSLVVEQPWDLALYSQGRDTTLLLVLSLLATAAVVVVWGLAVAREMTLPVVQLRDGVRTLGSGRLGETIAVDREDELGELAHEFNRMSQRLAASQLEIEQRNRKLHEGLQLAHMVQRDQLPQPLPLEAPIGAYAVCEPAYEIGGDFYTFVHLPDGRIRLVIGDASGQGVAAALVMALTSSLVDAHVRDAATPALALEQLNAELFPRLNPSHMSVALLVAEFDTRRGTLTTANAGMIAPLIVDVASCFYLPCWGPPLGIVEHLTFAQITHELRPEQLAIFISDGIVEARGADNAMWGFRSFEAAVCMHARENAERLVERVLSLVRAHTHRTPVADDMTIIATYLNPSKEQDSAYALLPIAERSDPAEQPAAGSL